MVTAPVVEYVAPAMEYITQAPKPLISTGPRNLLTMGNVVSERSISVDELFQSGRFFEAPAERATVAAIPAPVVYETFVEPVVEYITPAPAVEYVTAAPAVEYITAPAVEYVTGAPVVEYVTGAPVTYIA